MAAKPLFKLLQPDITISGTVLNLSIPMLQSRGIKGIIFDVDNTLVPIQHYKVSPEIYSWMETLRQHFQIWLVSNNLSHNRISRIAHSLSVPHIHRAAKPSRRALRQAITAMQLPVEAVAMVGDRLLTDILAGNRLGILTILVEELQPD